MTCGIYNNHLDVLETQRERILKAKDMRKQHGREAEFEYCKSLSKVEWCDGDYHGHLDGWGNWSVLGFKEDDGKWNTVKCPQVRQIAEDAPRSIRRHIEQTFATFLGNETIVAKVSQFPQSSGITLILQGTPGTGKTHLAHALEAQEREAQRSVEFITAIDLVRLFQEAQPWQDRDMRLDAEDEILNLHKSSIVILDDLGDETVSDKAFFRDQFKAFLDSLAGRLMITTNLKFHLDGSTGPGTLNEHLGDKISSRLTEKCAKYSLRGVDYRRGG